MGSARNHDCHGCSRVEARLEKGMEREKGDNPQSGRAETVELTMPQEIDAYKQRVGHRLIDVLMPATPPQAKNARA